MDQAPGEIRGGPYLWPDVHPGIPSPPASPPHGEGSHMAGDPITIVVCGPDVEWLEGTPVVEMSRRVEIVVSPEMRMQELVDTVMTVFFGGEHRDGEELPRWQIRLMPGYEVVPSSESIRIFPHESEGGTHALQPWNKEWTIRETSMGHRSRLMLTRLTPPVVTEQVLDVPTHSASARGMGFLFANSLG